ncbi:hypothetical protein SLU01_27110 [Sporosarcina luteola]|uniref:Uncharacterized protein n=1 Tax=Sporosarcina luteola TaxID=582850 RepID=A0A511ZAC3_9BACL|nr:hypothetical protein SLU01_27110 [Sporosarcina luteola]
MDWGEHALGVAEGASNSSYESLRQKDPFMTHLWRVPALSATNEESRKVKLSGTRTGVLLIQRGPLSFFINLSKGEYDCDRNFETHCAL